MNRSEIITGLNQYFQIYELVGEATYNKHKEDAWQFFRTETLHCLLIIREGIGKKCTINNWYLGGEYDERGLRTNVQEIVKGKTLKGILYLSGHPLGCAFDLIFEDIEAWEVRSWIISNEECFPCKIRLENLKNGKPISWTHFDTKYLERNPKVYLFNV